MPNDTTTLDPTQFTSGTRQAEPRSPQNDGRQIALKDTTRTISDEFRIFDRGIVRLEGTINGPWDVESRDILDTNAPWIKEGDSRPQTLAQSIVLGSFGLVYRVNLGTGNEGPVVKVFRIYTQTD